VDLLRMGLLHGTWHGITDDHGTCLIEKKNVIGTEGGKCSELSNFAIK
jgi:hypothetical protein